MSPAHRSRTAPRLRSVAAVAAVGCCALLATACQQGDSAGTGVAAPAPSSPSVASPSLSEDQARRKELLSATRIPWDKAADTAVGEVPRGKVVGIELKRTPTTGTGTASSPGTGSPTTGSPGTRTRTTSSPGTASPTSVPSPGAPEWAVEVAEPDGTVHDVEVDAVTGKVFRSRADADQDADDRREVADRLKRARQTLQQAVEAATGKKKGTVTDAELDDDDARRTFWSVDIVTPGDWHRTTYDIDAANGRILRERSDRD